MGLQQSKDQSVYEQVNNGNIQGIEALRREGAGLEWTDKEGKTPLMVACMSPELYNVAKTLIELGADVNAYCRGRNGGTPLHHAARRGLDQTVKLLLSHGAKALVMNNEYQTPLDIARFKGYGDVVRAIEAHVCLFSGWLRELQGPGFLELLAPQLLSRRVWVVVLPCGSRNNRKPLRLELAIYSNVQDGQPCTIVPLWRANLEEANYNRPDPVAIISHISKIPRRWRRRRNIKSSQEATRTRVKLVPVHESEKHQLQEFSNACKGIPQATHPAFPVPTAPPGAQAQPVFPVPTAPPGAQAQPFFPVPTAPPHKNSCTESVFDIAMSSAYSSNNKQSSPSHVENGTKCKAKEDAQSSIPAEPVKSDYIIPTDVQTVRENPSPMRPTSEDLSTDISEEEKEDCTGDANSSCTICLDAPVEGACIPCGHMVGCMSCLNEISDKKFGCPVCRSHINQVVRIYAA